MSYLSTPSGGGTYRIKVLDKDSYVECIPDATEWLQLNSLNTSKDAQKWKIVAVKGKSNVYTITSASNNAGVRYVKTEKTYWGYGYPTPQKDVASLNWLIEQRTTDGKSYSKVSLDVSDKSFYFDSNADDPNQPEKKRAVHFYYDKLSISSGPNQCFVFEKLPDTPTGSSGLDVIFLQDVTGSQQPYIDKARDEVANILNSLVKSNIVAANKLRANVVVFRDHPPQDDSFITQTMGFTGADDLTKVSTYLAGYVATGGGDGPECQSDALSNALSVDWNNDSTKVVILTTDSPPHGIGEPGDGIPDGCPLQNDPVAITDLFCDRGIVLYVISCEAGMAQYTKATEFYTGISEKTGGALLPLGDVNNIVSLINGALVESINKNNLATANKQKISGSDVDLIAKQLHLQFTQSKVQVDTLHVDEYYERSATFQQQVALWAQRGKKLAELKVQTKAVPGPRVKTSYKWGGQPSVSLVKQDITLEQTKTVVRMALASP